MPVQDAALETTAQTVEETAESGNGTTNETQTVVFVDPKTQSKPFWASVITSIALTAIAAIIAAIYRSSSFAIDLVIAAGFSIAISAAYVVVNEKILAASRQLDENGRTGEAAHQMVVRLMIASIVKLLVLGAGLVILILAVHLEPIPVVIGVTINYVAFLFVPWLASKRHSENPEPQSQQDKES